MIADCESSANATNNFVKRIVHEIEQMASRVGKELPISADTADQVTIQSAIISYSRSYSIDYIVIISQLRGEPLADALQRLNNIISQIEANKHLTQRIHDLRIGIQLDRKKQQLAEKINRLETLINRNILDNERKANEIRAELEKQSAQ
jgi:hypothetical protein